MKEFPIEQVSPEIIKSLQENQITIISTPTSSGKTMMVPKIAYGLSQKQVFCTVPRRILATEAMNGCNFIHGDGTAGFIHGEGDKDKEFSICYITEGSFIMRDLGSKLKTGSIVCFDEVHEQGKLLETLLYAAIEYAQNGLKIVLMSATLDIPKYKGYYEKRGLSVGVVTLPPLERMFDIEYQLTDSPEKAVAEAAKEGGRVLVGLAGKEEIERFQTEISRTFKGKIFQIHGEVEVEEQEEALAFTDSCVYLCTNMVQSGITIKGLTHGYFDGYGKRIQMDKGESKLAKYKLSKSEMRQWYGRLGRMCHGVIFVTSQKDIDLDGRDEMPTPEILRTSLEDSVLYFAYMGLKLIDCVLLNKPQRVNITAALEMLKKLGCAEPDGEVNSYGLAVISEGVGVRGGVATIKGRFLYMENLAKKVALVSNYRSFFSKNGEGSTPISAIKKWLGDSYEKYKHSDLLMTVGVVEYFLKKYTVTNEKKSGYIVPELELPLFKDECDNAFIFRRTLQNIMYNFYKVDRDTINVGEDFTDINQVIEAMYSDCITDAFYGKVYDGKQFRKVGHSSKSVQTVQKKAVGSFVCIEDSKKKNIYLIENVTYL
jgi:HrpA-like RNA helicase